MSISSESFYLAAATCTGIGVTVALLASGKIVDGSMMAAAATGGLLLTFYLLGRDLVYYNSLHRDKADERLIKELGKIVHDTQSPKAP